MSTRPPELAYRLLARSLAGDPAGPAIPGDLQEDFVRVVERSGPFRARAWYWREAVTLALGRTLRSPARARDARRQSSLSVNAEPQSIGLHGLLIDARNALRSVRRDLAFAFFAVLIIGIGVGASTAVFSVMNPSSPPIRRPSPG